MAQHDDRKEQKRVREEKKLDAIVEADIARAINELSDTMYGRRFLWWLLSIGGIFNNAVTANALMTYFRLGEQNMSQNVLAKINEANPAVYVRMMQENQNVHSSLEPDPVANSEPDTGSGSTSGEHDPYAT